MLVEWLGGPLDGFRFEAPDGMLALEVDVLLPYSIAQAMNNGWLPTRTVEIPVECRSGRYFVQYPC